MNSTHHKPTAPRGWRVLRKGEIVRRGDKRWSYMLECFRWVNSSIGDDVGCYPEDLPFIRRKHRSSNGKLPRAGKTRKIPTPSGKEVVGWVNVYQRKDGGLWIGIVQVSKKACDAAHGHNGLNRIACIPIYRSMLKRWRTK